MPGLDALKKENLADLKANIASLKGLNDPADIVGHLKNVMWPYLESFSTKVVDELHDMDAAMLEIAEGEGDMLSPETAGAFANHALISQSLAVALKARLTGSAEDAELGKKIEEFEILCAEVMKTIAEITFDADDAETEEDDDADAND